MFICCAWGRRPGPILSIPLFLLLLLLLCENILYLSTFILRQIFLAYASFLNSSHAPSFTLFFKVILRFNESIFENITHRLFRLRIKYIGYYIWTCFKSSFPTAFVPEYNIILTKWKSPMKKDPIPLPPFTLKLALYTGPMSPPPLWFT